MKKIKVQVEVSARHLHLSETDLVKLFGKNYKLAKKKDISQFGQFATKEVLQVQGPKGKFEKVRIVGPVRPKSQAELSVTDCHHLGIRPQVHISGQLKGAPKVLLIGPKGKINISAIVAQRHLHICPEYSKKYKLIKGRQVQVRVGGKRALVFDQVVVRVHPKFRFRLHLDTDEANAAGIKSGDQAEIIK